MIKIPTISEPNRIPEIALAQIEEDSEVDIRADDVAMVDGVFDEGVPVGATAEPLEVIGDDAMAVDSVEMTADVEKVVVSVETEFDADELVAWLGTVVVCTIEPSATVEYEASSMGPMDLKVQSWPVWPQSSKKGCNVSRAVSKYTEFPSATFSIP